MTRKQDLTSIETALEALASCNLKEANPSQSKMLCGIIDSLPDEFKSWINERICWPES
mgnify:CR=1 FL=1